MDGHVKQILLMCLTFGVLTECAVIKEQEKPVPDETDKIGEVVPPPILQRFPLEPKAESEYPQNRPTTPKVPLLRVPPRLLISSNANAQTPTHQLYRSPHHKVPLFQAPAVKMSSARPSSRHIPRMQPEETEEQALLRRQEWAEANGPKLGGNGISAIVHDPLMGERGVTALKDVERNACFINHYFEPFVLPSSQREFYAKNLPATVIESDDEQEQFQECVGLVVAKHCQDAKSYWLDKNLFFQFVDGLSRHNVRSRQSTSDTAKEKILHPVKKITDSPRSVPRRRRALSDCTCNTTPNVISPKTAGKSLLESLRVTVPMSRWLVDEKLFTDRPIIERQPFPRWPFPEGPDPPYANVAIQEKMHLNQLLEGK